MTTSAKEIDIIIPIYNRKSFIAPFFETIKAQTYSNFKLFFACGESQDDTDEELQKTIRCNPSVSISCAKVGRASVGQLRNYWLDSDELTGDYVAFLDVDDSFSPFLLEKMANKAEEDQSDLVQCAFIRTNPKTKKIISVDMAHNPVTPIDNPLDYTNIVFIHTGVPAKLFRHSKISQDARFGDSHRFEDVAFVAKFLASAKRVSFINEPLYNYVVSTSSISMFENKSSVEKELHDAQHILLDLKTYYLKANPKALQDGFLDSLAFLRYGIGLTTRACLSGYVKRCETIKETSAFLNANFPQWKTSKYLDKKNMKRLGKKARFIQWCKHLYRIHCFGLFIFNYSLYTKVLKKDIKP